MTFLSRARHHRRAVASGLALIVLGTAAVPTARAYQAVCAGPVATYPVLAAARDEARGEAASESAHSEPLAPILALRAAILDKALQVKQSDVIAFPAHVFAGSLLEVTHCPKAAAQDQWGKAARHAFSEEPARISVDGLLRTGESGPARVGALTSEIEGWKNEEPWHASNLDRVLQALSSTKNEPRTR